MKLAIITAHAGADSLKDALNSWLGKEIYVGDVVPIEFEDRGNQDCDIIVKDGRKGMLPAYQAGFEQTQEFPFLAFFHDDLLIQEEPTWIDRVLKEFEDPLVGLVGFGGALLHGSPALYNVPYDYHQLGRSFFRSNMVDAESHGERFTGVSDVAVLDGFALIVRREFLEKAGGWPLNTPISYVGYDYWLCCMAHRLGYKIRLVGVACQHLGGRTFVKLGLGQGPEHWDQFLRAHEYIYHVFKDVLPWRADAP